MSPLLEIGDNVSPSKLEISRNDGLTRNATICPLAAKAKTGVTKTLEDKNGGNVPCP
jgi:hypothetical protein